MITVSDFVESMQNLDILEEAAAALEDSAEVIKDKQRDQLLRGIKGDGKPIGKYRNRQYAARKHAMNPLAGIGNVDLKLTGAVHGDLFVDVREDEYIIDSADIKTGKLIEKYGDPFGLTEEKEAELINETLEEAFINRVKNKTGL